MSIAIVGGNDRMVRNYKDLCKSYNCKAKVFTQPAGIREKIGSPDLLILFTNTVSHKMVAAALAATSLEDHQIVRCHSSSITALKGILENVAQ
ncbi:DUF2325 domain-containing protein [Bengtsoniella intestinalis]|uniref:DUF2325 domain-containing protein n=1 Tax=Bengtsoniella intestinalis TaxID=3073143 RepID=UPI00391F6BF2